MKLGVVSDIHGNLPALLAVVADADKVDGWLNLGDIVSGPLWPAETAAWLMQQRWPTIAGNHERQALDADRDAMSDMDRFAAERLSPAQRDWMAALPLQMQPADGLLCVHGTPHSDLCYLLETVTPQGRREASAGEVAQRLGPLPTHTRWVLCGHSHVQRVVQVDHRQVLNPGSVGLQAFRHDQPHEHTVHSGSPRACYALLHQREGHWSAELRQVDYEHEAAARQAAAAGFDDWAFALRSGQPLP